MSPKQQPSFTELKVGLFVVIACAILAAAIFAIGSQVGLFQEQFPALTYLSNVSGLKPGDVVLLGGVEVGNVTSVEISRPGELPSTDQNRRILQRVAELQSRAEQMESATREAEEAVQAARTRHQQVLDQTGANSQATREAERVLREAVDDLEDLQRDLNRVHEDITRERSGLQNIEVEMTVATDYRNWIRRDSNISLGSIGLLGDKYIEISLGRSDELPLTVTRTAEGLLWDDEREFVLITGTQQASFGELITGANDILANFATLSDQVQDIVRNFEAGEGTIGRFIADPSFYNNLNSAVENADITARKLGDLIGSLGEGEGTISKLVRDDALHQRLLSATERLETLLTTVQEGEGTMGRLIHDPAVYDRTDSVLANIEEVTGRIGRGEGTLGRLSAEDELYVSLRASIDDLSALLKDVEEGRGTLGKLAKDEELYANLNLVSSEVVKLIYDFRQDPRKFLTIKFELF